MKRRFVPAMAALCALALLPLSCDSMPVNYSRSRSWILGGKTMVATVDLLGVTVERAGGWDSVEKEVTGFAPIFFWEEGCQIIPGGGPADYAADIQLREREYHSGWRTRRSLLVEVRLWPYNGGAADQSSYAQMLPLAAGQVTATGDFTFSSFETTNRMVSQAIRKAVRQLTAQKRGK